MTTIHETRSTLSTKSVSIRDVVSHYNIIGLAIGVAVGVAGKDFMFSLSDDVILPLTSKLIPSRFLLQYKLDMEKFVSASLTFFLVLATIILLLYVVLRPFVKDEISSDNHYKSVISQSMDAIITYQDGIKTDCDRIVAKLNKL